MVVGSVEKRGVDWVEWFGFYYTRGYPRIDGVPGIWMVAIQMGIFDRDAGFTGVVGSLSCGKPGGVRSSS